MPRNHGPKGQDGCDDRGGTGGAAGCYGGQTPLDELHRQGGSEADERAKQQAELTDDAAVAGFVPPPGSRSPFQ